MVDHVITSERIYKQLTEALKEYALIQMRVTYPLSEIRKKRKKRQDRCLFIVRREKQMMLFKELNAFDTSDIKTSPEESMLIFLEFGK